MTGDLTCDVLDVGGLRYLVFLSFCDELVQSLSTYSSDFPFDSAEWLVVFERPQGLLIYEGHFRE